jgi:CRISPR-associated protein Csx10
MKAITFSLTTQQPLLATSFQGDPNSDVSYSYIPGSMIRGAVIGRYMNENQLRDLNLCDQIIRDLFFEDESIQYLNAYLESKDDNDKKQRTLPVPISWVKDKDADLPKYESSYRMFIYDRATIDDLAEDLTPKSVQQRFCTVNGQSVFLYNEKRRINIHNKRDRSKGRSTKDQIDLVTKKVMRKGEGEIFRYDAIDADKTFQSVILCQTDEIYDEILRLLKAKDDIWLGGSQSAGYGHCKIEVIDEKCDRSDNWNEINISAKKRISQDNLVITLLSSAILRDEYGQPVADPNLVKCEIEKILEITDLPEAKPIYAGSENIGGFNRKWGLPLPQVPALSMGSVFVFEGYSLTEEQIKLLESQGIGERRIDGFGRVAVNWLSESEFQASSPKQVTLLETNSSMDVASQKIASEMTQRILRQNLDALLIKELSSKKLKGDISKSQLSRLRLVSRQAITAQNDFSLVKSMLDNLPSNSKKKFEQIKIGSKSFRDQIEEWLNDPKSWIVSPQNLLVKIRDIEAKLVEPLSSDPIAKEYTLRLIEAVAKKATKEGKENE